MKQAQGLGIRFNYYRLSWNAVPGAAFYSVSRNGIIISKGTDATQFSDTDIDPSMIYVYEIVAYSASSQIALGQIQVGPL